jgi:hypothetical protein
MTVPQHMRLRCKTAVDIAVFEAVSAAAAAHPLNPMTNSMRQLLSHPMYQAMAGAAASPLGRWMKMCIRILVARETPSTGVPLVNDPVRKATNVGVSLNLWNHRRRVADMRFAQDAPLECGSVN